MIIETIADKIEELRTIVGSELDRVEYKLSVSADDDRSCQLSMLREVLVEALLFCRNDWQERAAYRNETFYLAAQKRSENDSQNKL